MIMNKENSYLLGICFWLKEQPEAKNVEVTDENSIFYHVSQLQYAKLILRFLQQHDKIPTTEEIGKHSLTITELKKLVRDFQVDCFDGFVSNDEEYIENWINDNLNK